MVYDETPVCSPLSDEVLENLLLAVFSKLALLRMIIVNMRMDITRSVVHLMGIPPYLTKILMITIGHLWRIPFMIYLERGVLIQSLFRVLSKIPSFAYPQRKAFIQRFWEGLLWQRSMQNFHMIS